jgi:hypothetical protein
VQSGHLALLKGTEPPAPHQPQNPSLLLEEKEQFSAVAQKYYAAKLENKLDCQVA